MAPPTENKSLLKTNGHGNVGGSAVPAIKVFAGQDAFFNILYSVVSRETPYFP